MGASRRRYAGQRARPPGRRARRVRRGVLRALPRRAALPRVERLRRRPADGLDRHLGSAVGAVSLDRMELGPCAVAQLPAARAGRPARPARHGGAARVARRRHRPARGGPGRDGCAPASRARAAGPGDRAGREPRRYPRGRDRVGRGARPGAAGGSAPGPAARALRRRARARGRHHRAPDPARDHRGARRRAAAACPRLLRHGIDGGGRAADHLPARHDVDRPAHAALARAGVRARARGRGAGGGPRHAARQLGERSARCARRPGLARARRELLRGLAREVRRPRPRPRPAGERLRERLASTA